MVLQYAYNIRITGMQNINYIIDVRFVFNFCNESFGT